MSVKKWQQLAEEKTVLDKQTEEIHQKFRMNRGLSSFAVFFNFCSTFFHDYLSANAFFVPNNREKRYFVVINREMRELRLIIVHLTVNNRKPHDY